MRRIVMFNHVSADGYFAGPDGDLGWVVPDPEMEEEAVRSMPSADTTLLGRRTYEQFASFWPQAIRSPAAEDPHGGGSLSRAMREMGLWLDRATKLVFSRTVEQASWRNTRLLPELDPREIEALKRGPGGDILLFGSASIVSQLTGHGLIDEYVFNVDPVLLGAGRAMIRDVNERTRLVLLEARTYSSGNLKLRYAPAR